MVADGQSIKWLHTKLSVVNLLVGVGSSDCMFIMHEQLSAYVDVVRAWNDGVEYLSVS